MVQGPPGSGKTMLAQRMPGLLPEMSFDEAMEVTKIHSIAGQRPEGAALVDRQPDGVARLCRPPELGSSLEPTALNSIS